ncbi:hypothetical protein [Bradyrhizobium valentinum]|nr:hypothetical protein [Bradyrhizobium valentinum]
MAAVIDAARPLHPRQRSEFLRDVIAELGKYEVVGAGVIGRTCSKLQRKFLMPRTHHVGGKWG